MKNFFRSPLCWIALSTLALGSVIFSWFYFSQAFSLIQFNISMDRTAALAQADTLAKNYHLGPEEYHTAAAFETDRMVQTFIELDAGGKDAFVAMIENKLYQPYYWQIRHFKAYETNEVTFFFTPQGEPYGFYEKIADTTPGAQLSSDKAQKIAEDTARAEWNIDFSPYTLVEKSKTVAPSDRIDHTFVYERNERIGTGFYRLTLIVSGDKLTNLRNAVHVPEDFKRRYQEMRSANNSIAIASTLLYSLLYLSGGCGLGLFLLYRRRRVLWRQPALWALLIGGLLFINQFNMLPSLWMGYSTAVNPSIFFLQFALASCAWFVKTFLFLFLVGAAAESLTRAAFGNQPQLWSVWSKNNIHSLQTLGRTISAYFCSVIDLAFAIAFYIVVTRYFHWWIPTSTLYDPNILATYAPWLESIANSLSAGFSEECLFRAIPLAGAALIGSYYNRRNWWIGGALILQAIIFGAAHATYPMMPAYARVVELFVSSILWGCIYLKFGLLPTIITHFTYDVILFALPVFASSTVSAYLSQIIIIGATLIPLIVVLYGRIKAGYWSEMASNDYNKGWQVPPLAYSTDQQLAPATHTPITHRTRSFIYALGIMGLIVWCFLTPFKNDGSALDNRSQAITMATEALSKQGINPAEWSVTTTLFSGDYRRNMFNNSQRKFVWEQGGKSVYDQLFGNYIIPPYWKVSFVKFEGTQTERAEQYECFIAYANTNAHLFRIRHTLAENSSGESLSLEQARTLAHDQLQQKFALDSASLEEVSAESIKRPERLDWVLIYSDKNHYPLSEGQARIQIEIAGNQVVDAVRYVFVPEAWERNEQNKQLIVNIINLLTAAIGAIIFLGGIWLALINWNQIGTGIGLSFVCILTLLFVRFINAIPTVIASINTSEPFWSQFVRTEAMNALSFLVQGSILALLLALVNSIRQPQSLLSRCSLACIGAALGATCASILALCAYFIPRTVPLWGNYNALEHSSAIIAGLLSYLLIYINLTLFILLVILLLDYVSARWHIAKLLTPFVLIGIGVLFAAYQQTDNLLLFFLLSFGLGIYFIGTYFKVVKNNYALIPMATATYVLCSIIQETAFNILGSASLIIGVISSVLIIGLACGWTKKLYGNPPAR
jgi:hypothetical protein